MTSQIPHTLHLWRQQLELRHGAGADPVTLARLLRAKDLIESCYHEPLSLEQIAAAASLSMHHFHRLYKRRFGVTPHQALTSRRIQEAKRLLATTSMPITQVCFEVGFESLGSFSDLFKRHVGEAPSMYRRRLFHIGWNPRARSMPMCMYMRFMGGWDAKSKIGEAKV